MQDKEKVDLKRRKKIGNFLKAFAIGAIGFASMKSVLAKGFVFNENGTEYRISDFTAGGGGDNDKVGIDSAATADYLGNASGDGVLRAGSNLSYVDGGNFITLDVDSTKATNWDAANTHIGESGASHTYIDQSVVSGGTPTFTGTNFTGVPAAGITAGTFGTGAYVFDNTVGGITTLTTNIINIEDGNSIIAEDASSNMTFTDAVTGTKTLAELAAGGAGTPTDITVADESADTTCFPCFFTAATGDLGPKTGTNLTFNSSTGLLTATTLAGANTDWDAASAHVSATGASHSYIDQDITSGSSPTFTGTNITAVASITAADESADTSCYPLFATATTGAIAPKTGTNLTFNSATGQLGLELLQVDNININGSTISSTGGVDINIVPFAGNKVVIDTNVEIEDGVISGVTKIVSDSSPFQIILPVQSGKVGHITSSASLDGTQKRWYYLFDASTIEYVDYEFIMPAQYVSTQTITVKLNFTMASATSGNVVWGVRFMAVSPNDAAVLETDSFDTAIYHTEAVPAAAGRLDQAVLTASNAAADGVAAGDTVIMRVYRNANHASDIATGDAELTGIILDVV